jgi:hypothetical protein
MERGEARGKEGEAGIALRSIMCLESEAKNDPRKSLVDDAKLGVE